MRWFASAPSRPPRALWRAAPAGGADGASPPASADATPGAIAGVKLTHPDRVLYPEIGLTKRDLARYHEAVADWILPHLADRPTTLLRCPDRVGAKCFFQRHARPGAGTALRRVRITMDAGRGEFLVAESLPALIELTQMSVLEIHTLELGGPSARATRSRGVRPGSRPRGALDSDARRRAAGPADAADREARELREDDGGKGLRVVQCRWRLPPGTR